MDIRKLIFGHEGGGSMQVNNNNAIMGTNESTQSAFDQVSSLGKDDFLKLLITQLRYQDPLQPVDDKEFIAQLAQFSSLEQMQNLSTTMNTMMASQQKLTALGQATNMIGKIVELHTHEGKSLYGKVSGVQFMNGWPELVVDGKTYDFTEIVSIFEEGAQENGD